MRAMQVVDWGKPLELRQLPTPESLARNVRRMFNGLCVTPAKAGVQDTGTVSGFPISRE